MAALADRSITLWVLQLLHNALQNIQGLQLLLVIIQDLFQDFFPLIKHSLSTKFSVIQLIIIQDLCQTFAATCTGGLNSLCVGLLCWCHNNSLQLNTSKTKELVIDFGRDRPRPRPVQIGTEEVEGVQTYKYLGLWLDNRLDWTSNTRQLYKKTQSRMYFLRRLRSFNICRKLLWMFYQSVAASVLSYAVVCWGGGGGVCVTKADLSRLEKLIRRAARWWG
ncbi:hypothetical protein D4764_06G0004510 [Takifugu flavidus]|uniref:Alkylated DNA repair protein AlkB homologue 8 N-terminal domain-containing protein n=1 Tax=Takifugu flavidus TaxID=433684 RepID=A0A5C6MXW6_9TELE|nr:hypothetical protein D4764_06G0004510 [Takifugu flavidus]